MAYTGRNPMPFEVWSGGRGSSFPRSRPSEGSNEVHRHRLDISEQRIHHVGEYRVAATLVHQFLEGGIGRSKGVHIGRRNDRLSDDSREYHRSLQRRY